MDDNAAGELQIYSIEEKTAGTATCAVRCVGGVVRTGRPFRLRLDDDATGGPVLLSLDWIKLYGKVTDSLYPSYSALAQFSGDGVSLLARGLILASSAKDES
ncbi:hypothetical protein ACFYWO_34465 [Streptomyces sp. NPDC002932]|uniref:hypothetical protein n=1 Tax=Streptomyces sp. NPDC002932 TaxID=3364672 RepID=UPI0036CA932C